MVFGDEPEAARKLIDRPLQGGIVERDQLPALVAHEMVVVVLAARINRLVSRDSVTEIEPADQVVIMKELERAVDAGATDRPLVRAETAQPILDLQGAQGTVLPGEQIDQPLAGGAAMVSGPPQHLPRMDRPLGVRLLLHAAKHNPRLDT